MPFLSASGEALPDTGWMGALGQGLGKGVCEWRNPILGYSLWTKGRVWRGGQAPLTSCSGWRLPARSWDIWVRFSSGAEKTQRGWHLHPYWLGTQVTHNQEEA